MTREQNLLTLLVNGPVSVSQGIMNCVIHEISDVKWWDVDKRSYDVYVKEVRKLKKRLSFKEEQALILRKEKGSRAAFDELIKSHLLLVIYIARKYQNLGLPLNDLISEGNLGLMRGVQNISYGGAFRLSSFVFPYISNAIKTAIKKYSRQVAVPGTYQVLSYKINRFIERDMVEFGEIPSVDRIAGSLGISRKQVVECESLVIPEVSIDSLVRYFES